MLPHVNGTVRYRLERLDSYLPAEKRQKQRPSQAQPDPYQ